jgi:YidC/Oxa1 family membrane protein insertase
MENPPMDRRTALAFALIFLILVGSQYIMPKIFPPDPLPEIPDSTLVAGDSPLAVSTEPAAARPDFVPDTSAPVSETTNALDTVEQALRLKPGSVEKTLTVTTPLYRLVISSLGGRIISFETLDHLSHLGGPVQLIPAEIPRQGVDALVFRSGTMELGGANFRFVDGEDLDILVGDGPQSIDLAVETLGGLGVHKIITFHPDTYGMDVDYFLTSTDPELSRHSLNLLGSLEDFRFGWNQGISMTERIERMEKPAMRSLALVGDQLEAKKRDGLEKSREKVEGVYSGSVHYAAVQNKYFTVFGIVPQGDSGVVEGTIRLSGDKDLMAQSWTIDLPANRGTGSEIATAGLHLYVGPADESLVQVYGQNIEKGIDLGMKIIRPLSSLVLTTMSWLHNFIPNYGLIIILFSVITKLAFYPLSKAQTESMKRMQEIQPKIKALQTKYKDDKDKLNQATMALYKEEKVNPLAGCLPMIVQMPVFFALYQALNHTIALRGQPFVLWITDLSQPDSLFALPFTIPMLGSDFNVLPILMSVAMFYQTKLTPSTGGGQMAAMNTMLPLIMVFIFYNMPSGLVLYWLVNTIMQVYQSWRIHSKAAANQGVQTA